MAVRGAAVQSNGKVLRHARANWRMHESTWVTPGFDGIREVLQLEATQIQRLHA